MKKFTIIILFLSIPFFLNAQFCEWTDPVALTDSVSFNTNPNIIITDDYYSGDVFMFYEKKWNEDSTKQIYMRNITSMSDEQLAVGDGIFEFRNPQLYKTGYSNCRYFLIYESDLTGNFDLYGIEFFEDATFSVPFCLTETEYDENSCYIGDDYYNVTWEADEKIKVSTFFLVSDTLQFNEIITIDTNACFEPVSSYEFIVWRKIEEDSSHIYSSSYNYSSGEWSEPDTVYTSGHNINLSMSTGMDYWCFPVICWENSSNIICYDLWEHDTLFPEYPGITEYNYPSMFNYDYFVLNNFYPYILTYSSGVSDESEIYSYTEFYGNENISNNNYADIYPRLFYGRTFMYYYDVLNIWQSYRNEHIVLYISKISISYGSISENYLNEKDNLLSVIPNPFSNCLKIKCYLSNNSSAIVKIYNLYGQEIKHFNISDNKKGWHTLHWEPGNGNSTDIPKGIYTVLFQQGNIRQAQKVIYSGD
jgi:hypothetical protein